MNEPENTHHPEFDAGPRLAEAICIDDYFEADRLPLWERVRDWTPGWKYKSVMGSIAVGAIAFVSQNIDTFHKWENWDTDQYYPTPPDECRDYVDMERDLWTEAIPINNGSTNVVASPAKAAELTKQGVEFSFQPNVSNHTSSAREFDSSGVAFGETIDWLRSIFDHPIEEFVMEQSGLRIRIFSDSDEAAFITRPERFSELFHLPLSNQYHISDPHYSELHTCSTEAFGFPESVNGQTLDVFCPQH